VAIIKITEAVRAAARRLLQDRGLTLDRSDRDRLAAIAGGKRKQLDALWWKKLHRVVDQNKLGKIAGLADLAGNPNAHERAVAAAKLKAFKGRVPPGLLREPPPLPSRIEDWKRKPSKRQPARPSRRGLLGGVNEKPKQAGGVNAKPSRTGDRHLNKGDRHAPGYMRDYMRRRRAAAKTNEVQS